MTIVLPLAVCLVGLVMYLLFVNPKASEVGRICFAFGLLVFLLKAGPQILNVLR